MAGNREVGEEEMLAARQGVDPGQHAGYGGGLVHSEARVMIARDIAGVFQGLVAAVADNRLHSEIAEASRVEQGGTVTRIGQNCSYLSAVFVLVCLGPAVEGWKRGTQDRVESLYA